MNLELEHIIGTVRMAGIELIVDDKKEDAVDRQKVRKKLLINKFLMG